MPKARLFNNGVGKFCNKFCPCKIWPKSLGVNVFNPAVSNSILFGIPADDNGITNDNVCPISSSPSKAPVIFGVAVLMSLINSVVCTEFRLSTLGISSSAALNLTSKSSSNSWFKSLLTLNINPSIDKFAKPDKLSGK